MNDFSLSLLESMQLLLMSSSKETASELDTFFTEKLLLFCNRNFLPIAPGSTIYFSRNKSFICGCSKGNSDIPFVGIFVMS